MDRQPTPRRPKKIQTARPPRLLPLLLLGVALLLLFASLAKRQTYPPSVAPLTTEHGIYLCRLGFDGADAECVVDTGSTNLLLAGRSCRSCDDPTALRVRAPATAMLRYGSQSSRVTWRDGTLRLGGRANRVRAALARSMEGETQYNVLGLARGALQRAVAPRRFAVVMRGRDGLLALDRRGIRAVRRLYAERPHRIPLLPDRVLYAVQGEIAAQTVEVIVDTGSNFLTVPKALFQSLKLHANARRPIPMRLGGRVTLHFGPEIYMHPNGTLLIDEEEDDEEAGAVILGAFFLRGLAVEFDGERLGIAALRRDSS